MSEVTKEVQDAIDAAVEEATSGLKAKNTELLGKLKKAQQGATIDPAEHAALEAERDQLKADVAAANKAVTKATKDAEAAIKKAADAESYTSKLLVDNGLSDALIKAGVTNPVHQKAAKAMLAGQVELVDENGAKVARLNTKALADAITDWAGSDEGKHFVTAPDASGGGANNNGRPANPSPGDMGGDKAARIARAEQLLAENAA